MYKHILLATDLTDECRIVAEKAVLMAKMANAKLSLVHVIEPIPTFGYPGFADLSEQGLDEAKQALANLGESLSVHEDMQHIMVGSTKHEILHVADELNIDLIITGSHGRHGLSLLLGSTANAILHGAKCDVLTVRFTDEQS